MQRPERIAHDSQFIRPGSPEALFDRARMRPVGNALRVKTERAGTDAPASLVVALDVVEDLVAVEVAVVVWNRHGLRMKVQDPRAE